MHSTRIAVLLACVSLTLPVLACSGVSSITNMLSGEWNDSSKQIGYQVGDNVSDFSIPLTNGETVSYSASDSDRTPVFLFFLSPS